MTYDTEIQALRGFAILLVLVHHARLLPQLEAGHRGGMCFSWCQASGHRHHPARFAEGRVPLVWLQALDQRRQEVQGDPHDRPGASELRDDDDGDLLQAEVTRVFPKGQNRRLLTPIVVRIALARR